MNLDELAHVEAMCSALLEGHNEAARSEAQEQLNALQSSTDFIPQCQFILDNSTQWCAQVVASSSLENLITQFWNSFTVEQKVMIRNYVLNYLATKAPTLNDYVLGNLTKLTSRITKLGWFDSAEHRDIIDKTRILLEDTIDNHIVGLRLLIALVDEMNIPTMGRTLTVHRRTAVSFRDQCLFQAFQISIQTLHNLRMGSIDASPEQTIKVSTSIYDEMKTYMTIVIMFIAPIIYLDCELRASTLHKLSLL